ncbi:MAG: SusC/RagA family TonB-linked outer membrane protein [Prolixibacteraceae bacterium]|nr:SusC/RagA family TonB-linked outer membrane protein [Prolixibacteraceae bacterium]
MRKKHNSNFSIRRRWCFPVKLLFLGVFLFTWFGVSAQQREVTGTVTDSQKQPLPGVTVLVKGTTTGTVTNTDGNFSLSIPESAETLQFSFVGMKTQEIPVSGKTTINVVMEENVIGIEEVVAIGYGTLNKKELTTSVTHIAEKDFLDVPSTNPIMQVQGKIAGVQIQRTGGSDPNAGESIQIRGAGSRVAGTGPLVVIDGIPGGDLKNVDNNDIESIDVLKGGAAAAIYGTRAANGVIIITTKSGGVTEGIRVDYNGYISTEMIKNELELLSVDEFLELGINKDEGARTDWFGELTNNFPVSHSHSLALSSGNKKTQYRASVLYKNFDGIDIATAREEYGARINIHHTAMDGLFDFDFNVAPRFVDEDLTEYSAFYQAIHLNPTLPVMDPDNPSQYSYIVAHDTWNPVEQLELEQREAVRKYFTGSGKVQLNILPNLNTSLMYAIESNDRQYNFFSPSTSTNSKSSDRRGQATRQQQNWDNKMLDWLVNYIYEQNEFITKFLGGYSYQYFHYSAFNATNYDFPSDAVTFNDLGSGTYLKDGRAEMWSDRNSSTIIAFFGRANLAYLDKYFLSASMRREGSSKFGANNKWGWFPGVSAGWRITGEEFMGAQTFFNDLKLRADYGVTGNQGFPSYRAQKLYSGAGYYYTMGRWIQGFGPGNNYNPDLAWERSVNFNIGIDFSILNNSLGGSFEYYDRTSDGLLGQYDVAVPPNTHTQTWVNVGKIKNTGVEMTLNASVLNQKDFGYNLTAVAAYNKNWLVSFSEGIYEAGQVYLNRLPAPGSPGPTMLLEEGSPVGSWYMFKHAGIDENGMLLAYKKVDGKYTDEKQLIQGLEHDQKYHAGTAVPKVTASLSNSFRYKNFDLNLFFRGAFGHKILNEKNMYFGLKAFKGANLLRKAYFPTDKGIQLYEVNDSKRISDFFLQKGDWVKLDVVSLGYTFPELNKFRNLRIYFSGKNMFLFTNYDGLDPELAPINGLEPGRETQAYYPVSRTLTFGIQASF